MFKEREDPNKSSNQNQKGDVQDPASKLPVPSYSNPEEKAQPISRSHELQYLLPNDTLDKTLDYLTPE